MTCDVVISRASAEFHPRAASCLALYNALPTLYFCSLQFAGDAKAAADAFAERQQRRRQKLAAAAEAAAASAAETVTAREKAKKGRGGGGSVVEMSNVAAMEGGS